MTRTRQLARAGVRRRFFRSLVSLLGTAMIISGAIALLGVTLDRLAGPGLAWWHWTLWPALGALVVSITIAYLRRGAPLDAAVEIDHALGLNDRLSSALELEREAPVDAFARVAVADAERLAPGASIKRAMPIRFGRTWIAWPALLVVTGLVGWFLEPLDLLGGRHAQARPADDPVVQTAAEDIRDLASQLDGLDERIDDPTTDDPSAEAQDLGPNPRELLDELSHQLLDGQKSADEARTEAAGILEDEARRRERKAQRIQREQDALSRALQSLTAEPSSSSAGTDALMDDLRDDLQRGDLQSAAEELAQIEERLREMDPSERENLANEMRRLSEDLDQLARQERERAERERQRAAEDLAQRGIDPDLSRELEREPDADEIQKRLEEEGFTDDQARRLAKELAEQNAEREAREQAADRAQELSEVTQRAADDVAQEDPKQPGEQTSPQEEPGEPGSEESSSADDGQQPDANQQDENAQDGAPQEQGEPPQQDPQSQSGQGEQQEQPDQEQSGEEGEAQEGNSPDGDQPDQPTPTEGIESPAGAADPTDPEQGGGEGEPPPTETPDGAPSSPGAGAEQENPDDGASESPPDQPGGAQMEPGGENEQGESTEDAPPSGGQESSQPPQLPEELPEPTPENVRALKEMLEQMQQEQEQSEELEEQAQDLRDQAREMYENMSEEERKKLERWAEALQNEFEPGGDDAGDQGAGFGERGEGTAPDASRPFERTDLVDARPSEPSDSSSGNDRIASEWLNPDAPPPERGEVSTREMIEQLEQAEKDSAKALEERQIPPRYGKVLEEYFRKARERAREAEDAEETDDTPAPAAKDAGEDDDD